MLTKMNIFFATLPFSYKIQRNVSSVYGSKVTAFIPGKPYTRRRRHNTTHNQPCNLYDDYEEFLLQRSNLARIDCQFTESESTLYGNSNKQPVNPNKPTTDSTIPMHLVIKLTCHTVVHVLYVWVDLTLSC